MMRAEITDFWAMVFNPSTVHRLVHVWLGSFIMGAFFVMSISAWYLLKRRHVAFAERSFRGALLLAAASSVALGVSGHFQAKSVYAHQPAKMAAFEGLYETPEGGAPLALFGLPDDEDQTLRGAVEIPAGLSLLIHEDPHEPVLGLDAFHPEHRPRSLVPFFSYRLMVGCGVFFIVLCGYALLRMRKGTLFSSRWLMGVFLLSVVPAVAANQAGWVAAETGRQPWIVHPAMERGADGEPVRDEQGYVQYATVTAPTGEERVAGLRTTDAVSRAIEASQVLRSIVMFGLLYLLLGFVWAFLMYQKVEHGPDEDEEQEGVPRPGVPFGSAAGAPPLDVEPAGDGGAA